MGEGSGSDRAVREVESQRLTFKREAAGRGSKETNRGGWDRVEWGGVGHTLQGAWERDSERGRSLGGGAETASAASSPSLSLPLAVPQQQLSVSQSVCPSAWAA